MMGAVLEVVFIGEMAQHPSAYGQGLIKFHITGGDTESGSHAGSETNKHLARLSSTHVSNSVSVAEPRGREAWRFLLWMG